MRAIFILLVFLLYILVNSTAFAVMPHIHGHGETGTIYNARASISSDHTNAILTTTKTIGHRSAGQDCCGQDCSHQDCSHQNCSDLVNCSTCAQFPCSMSSFIADYKTTTYAYIKYHPIIFISIVHSPTPHPPRFL
jgi:hypothetical protein